MRGPLFAARNFFLIFFLKSLISCNAGFFSEPWLKDYKTNYHEIIQNCSDICAEESIFHEDLETYGCESYEERCSAGCIDFGFAVDWSCETIAISWRDTLSPCDLAYFAGCRQAIDGIKNHLSQLSDFQTPLFINPVKNSTSTGLILSWPIIEYKYSTEKLVVEWTYADGHQNWWPSSSYHWIVPYICQVGDLRPYTNYRFRVSMMVSNDSVSFVHSSESEIIQTVPMGVPSSPPEIINVLSMGHDKIAVFWKQGRFINAPLQGYKIKTTNLNSDEKFDNEVIIDASDNYTVLHNLKPQQYYNIEVSMINLFGNGPSAMKNGSTTSPPTGIANPAFIVVGEYKVTLLNTSVDGSTAKELYTSDQSVLGFDILIGQQTFFISDDSGHIYKIKMPNEAERDAIYSPKSVPHFKPSKLSIDWANSYLYIVGEISNKSWLIARTGFYGYGLTIVVKKLKEKPLQLYVDPINGYLFWITIESGVFRMDMTDNSWKQIYEKVGLTAFTVDPDRYWIIIFSSVDRKFTKITFDGRFSFDEEIEISSEAVLNLVSHHSYLFWTDGEHIYSNQSITVLYGRCQFLKIFQPSAQLTPNPTRVVGNLQILATSDKAKLFWETPKKDYFQSDAAWTDRNYDIEMKEGGENPSEIPDAQTIRNIKTEFFTVEKLKPNVRYFFRVRATNLHGVAGPWSDFHRVITWTVSEDRHLLWATENGLLSTNEIGGNLETLLNGSISGMTWTNRSLYLVKESQIIHFDEFNVTEIFVGTLAGSVAYDWMGKKLYYTDKLKGTLIRANLDGTERELLPLFDINHIELDSANGYLYYSDGVLVAVCTMSGRDCITYYETYPFLNQDIYGPIVDLEENRIFWMTQSDGDVRLYSAATAPAAKISNCYVTSPFFGFSIVHLFSKLFGRIIWSTKKTNWIFSEEDSRNENFLKFNGTINGVIVAEKTHEDETYYSVIPPAINASTIKVTGLWDNFNITWQSVDSEAGYNVSYFIKINYLIFFYTYETYIHYPHNDLPPYTLLTIWIRSSSPWSTGLITKAQVFSPTAAPSKPERLRVFINCVYNPWQGSKNISAVVRWEPPKEPNGPIVLYSISCHRGDELIDTQNSTDIEVIFWGLEDNTTYDFRGQAFTSGAGGAISEPVKITVNSEYQSVPKILVTSSDRIGVLDIELNSTEILTTISGSVRHLATIRDENRIFWISGARRIMSYYKGNSSILSSLESDVQALTVDWISRVLYWSQEDPGGGSTIHFIDLNHFEGMPMSGQLLISNPKPIRNLVILPLSQTLLWLELDGNLSGWNLRDLTELNLLLGTNATYQSLYPGCFEEQLESVVLVDEMQTICVLNLRMEICQTLNVDMGSENLHLAWDNGFIYALKNQSIRAYNRRQLNQEYMVSTDAVNEITALSLQPYPETRCLLPHFTKRSENNLLIQLLNTTKHSLELRFPTFSPPQGCSFKIPGLEYNLFLKEIGKEVDIYKQLHSFDAYMNVTDLKPFTKYTLHLAISNYYAKNFRLPELWAPEVTFMTAPGTPSVPRNITVSAVSPRDGLVQWMHPDVLSNEHVWYEVHWQTENPTNGVVHRHQKIIPEGGDKWNLFLLSSLRPDHKYSVWIKVFSTDTAFNSSSTYDFETFSEPGDLAFVDSTAYSLTLSWNSSSNVTSAFLLYSPLYVDDPISVNITSDSHARVIESLEPKTKYRFHLKLFYLHWVHPYVWPPDNRFVFETLGDRPGAPGQPLIVHIKGEVFNIFWEPAKNNGAPIEEYSIEAMQATQAKRFRRSHYFIEEGTGDRSMSNKTLTRMGQLPWAEEIEPIPDKWILYCNVTDTNCIITELHTLRLLMFRGRARNSYGWGPYSADSEMIAEPFVSPRKRDTLVFAIIAPLTIVLTCVSMVMMIRYVHGRRKQAKKLRYKSRPSIWGLDVATLQQVARSRNFSQTSSMLYTGKPLTDSDIALLPQISRGQINMHKFLGSGAFGEVYEGVVTYSEDASQDRVAVKTLRKGASEQEKTELLQEAHLMSHFKHENIVNLIGVCFDVDSICIIMELMEGGDLQTYLRQSRPTFSKLGTLSLLDLIGMCLDVCTGCRYLEDLHFLHRDLACRNCLVSSVDPQFRVVKIGDFGLARDIYKSDYYRKEGEGLLPVRWMAPECLVDGVFTSQSDIWSFGILLWEILSLGQQPYPAQSNLEVLNFVKQGERLQQPEECPDKLYNLMIQCWSHNPEERPTFQLCLNELLSMKLQALNMKHFKNYEGGITNMSYAESDEGSISNVSISSKDEASNLNNSFVEAKQNQRNNTEDSTSELNLLRLSTVNEGVASVSQSMKDGHRFRC